MARLLLEFGADPYARMVAKEKYKRRGGGGGGDDPDGGGGGGRPGGGTKSLDDGFERNVSVFEALLSR